MFLSTARSDNEWNFFLEENNVQLYKKKISHEKYAEAKGVGVLSYPPSACMRMIMKAFPQSENNINPHSIKLDPDKLEAHVLHDLTHNGHLTLEYMRFRGAGFVVTPRDFVNLTQWRVLNDGSIACCGTTASKELQEKYCPPKSGFVRADAMMGGWLFEPLNNGRETKATLIMCLDLKGMLPGWLIAQVTKTQPLCIATLRELLDQDVIDY